MDWTDYGFLFKAKKEALPEIELGSVTIPAGVWMDIPTDCELLKYQREALGLTLQEVANRAHINIRQYQKFESGERSLSSASFRVGLNVCYALGIDPMYYCTAKDYDLNISQDNKEKG